MEDDDAYTDPLPALIDPAELLDDDVTLLEATAPCVLGDAHDDLPDSTSKQRISPACIMPRTVCPRSLGEVKGMKMSNQYTSRRLNMDHVR